MPRRNLIPSGNYSNPMATGVSSFANSLNESLKGNQAFERQKALQAGRQKSALELAMERYYGQMALQKEKGKQQTQKRGADDRVKQDKLLFDLVNSATKERQAFRDKALSGNYMAKAVEIGSPEYNKIVDDIDKKFAEQYPTRFELSQRADELLFPILQRNPSLKPVVGQKGFKNAAPTPLPVPTQQPAKNTFNSGM